MLPVAADLNVVLFLLILYGMFVGSGTGIGTLCSALPAEVVHPSIVGAALGFMNTFSQAGQTTAPLLFGVLLEISGQNYIVLFPALIICFSISMTMLLIGYLRYRRPYLKQ